MKIKLSAALLGVSVLLASCRNDNVAPAGDTTAPSVSVTATQTGNQVKLSAVVTDASPITRVEFYRAGNTTPLNTDTTSPYEATLGVSSTDNGPMSFTVKAYDSAGNMGSASTSLNVYVAPPAPTPVGKTLYQGVWLWLVFNDDAQAVRRSGLAVLNEEEAGDYGKVASGGYGEYAVASDPDSTLTSKGVVLLGPLTGVGQLQARFAIPYQGSVALDILADDDDNRWDTLESGAAFFFDDDAEIRVPGGQAYSAPFGLAQISMDIPANAQPPVLPAARALLERAKSPALASQSQRAPFSPSLARQLAANFTKTLSK